MFRSFVMEVSFAEKQLIELPFGSTVTKEIRPLGIDRPCIPITIPGDASDVDVMQPYELLVYPIDGTDCTLKSGRTFLDASFIGFYCRVLPDKTQLYAFFLEAIE